MKKVVRFPAKFFSIITFGHSNIVGYALDQALHLYLGPFGQSKIAPIAVPGFEIDLGIGGATTRVLAASMDDSLLQAILKFQPCNCFDYMVDYMPQRFQIILLWIFYWKFNNFLTVLFYCLSNRIYLGIVSLMDIFLVHDSVKISRELYIVLLSVQ